MAENANGYRRGDTYQCGMAESREDEVSPAASLLYAGLSSSVAMPALRFAPFAGPLGRERFTFIDLFADAYFQANGIGMPSKLTEPISGSYPTAILRRKRPRGRFPRGTMCSPRDSHASPSAYLDICEALRIRVARWSMKCST